MRTLRVLVAELLIHAAIVLPAIHLTAVVIYFWSGEFGLVVGLGCVLWVGVLLVAGLHRSTRPLRGRWSHLWDAGNEPLVWGPGSDSDPASSVDQRRGRGRLSRSAKALS
jgi:hypothetical protein